MLWWIWGILKREFWKRKNCWRIREGRNKIAKDKREGSKKIAIEQATEQKMIFERTTTLN